MNKKNQIFTMIFIFINVFCKGIGLNNSSKIYLMLLLFGIILTITKVFTDKYNKKEFIWMIFLVSTGILTFIFTKSPTFLLTCLCISCMKNVDLNKTFKGMLYIRAFTFILMMTLSLNGIISNKVITHYRNGEFINRQALGYGHPNTTQINLFIIIALYIYLRYDKMKFADFVILAGSNYYIYTYTYSRTCFYCGVILILFAFVSKSVKNKKIIYKLPRCILIAMFVFSIITAILYGKNTFVEKLNKITTGRLAYSNYYLKHYPVALFGNNIKVDNNAIIDNGYIMLLIEYGLVPTCLFLYLMLKICKRTELKKDIRKVIIMIPFFLVYFTESFLPNVFMNIILMFSAEIIFNNNENYQLLNNE